jgi:prepilin-type N-terminal cleavage/methylation domain-containing protein
MRHRNGFSLIELLVVVAIISLLVSILAPSLTKAKDLARSVLCRTNLHQIGTAWSLFWQEHDGIIDVRHWYGWGGFDPGIEAWNWGINGPPIDQRPLCSFIESNELYKCPSDNRRGAVLADAQTNWEQWGTSYAINWLITTPDMPGRDPALYIPTAGDFREPSTTILMGEATMFASNSPWRLVWPGGVGEYSWHSDEGYWNNLLFGDLHAEYLLLDWDFGDNGAGAGYRWWEP